VVLRARLITCELISAVSLAFVVLLVPPSQLSKTYAVITIVTSVLPGSILTGDVKMIIAGLTLPSQDLLPKIFVSTGFNVPIGFLVLALDRSIYPLSVSVGFVLLSALGSAAQVFSSMWFYLQPDKSLIMDAKLLSTSVKIVFAGMAAWRSELVWALLGTTLGSVVEFSLNLRSTLLMPLDCSVHHHKVFPVLGIAYGLSRIVSASIKIGLSIFFGPLISSFLLVEQLVGGANSLFEKYFLRSLCLRLVLRSLKIAYLVGMVVFIPWLASISLQTSGRLSILCCAIVACANVLPLSEMYAALARRGQNYVAIGSAAVSLLCSLALIMAFASGVIGYVSLIAYIALPGLTFIFYLLSDLDACNHAKP
jgi:hypothetical protein